MISTRKTACQGWGDHGHIHAAALPRDTTTTQRTPSLTQLAALTCLIAFKSSNASKVEMRIHIHTKTISMKTLTNFTAIMMITITTICIIIIDVILETRGIECIRLEGLHQESHTILLHCLHSSPPKVTSKILCQKLAKTINMMAWITMIMDPMAQLRGTFQNASLRKLITWETSAKTHLSATKSFRMMIESTCRRRDLRTLSQKTWPKNRKISTLYPKRRRKRPSIRWVRLMTLWSKSKTSKKELKTHNRRKQKTKARPTALNKLLAKYDRGHGRYLQTSTLTSTRVPSSLKANDDWPFFKLIDVTVCCTVGRSRL